MALFRSTSCRLLNGLNQSFLEFGVTWFRGNIDMAAKELESAEFEWSFDNTRHLINLCEIRLKDNLYDIRSKDHKNRDMRDRAVAEIAAKIVTSIRKKFL